MSVKPTYEELEQRIKELEGSGKEFATSLVNNAPTFFVAIDAQGKTMMMNQLMLKVLGYTVDEVVGKDYLSNFVPGKDRDTLASVFRTLSAEHEHTINVNRILSKDGKEFLVEWYGTSVFDTNRKFQYFYGFGIDITERKQAELKLREALTKAQRFRDALDHVPSHIYMKDTQSRYVYANRLTLELFGCSAEELVGCDDTRFFPPDTVKRLREVDSRVFQGEQTTEEIDVADEENGRRVYWEVKTPIYAEPESKTIWGLIGISTDITESKIIEEKLRGSEATLKSIFRAAPTGIGMVVDRVIKEANERLCEITGYSREELIGKSARVLYPTDEDFELVGLEKYKQIRDQSTGTVETRFQQKDGKVINILLSSTPITPNDKSLGVTFTALDITKRKLLEEQLRQAHKMEAIGTLSGGIAHEFNNILAIILGNAELAVEDIPEGNPASNFLNEIRTASLRGKDVVRNILSVARKTMVAKKPIQISTIVKESIRLLQATIPTIIDIRHSLLCESEMILADATEIQQVLVNLCTNSAHAIGEEVGILGVKLEAITLNQRSTERYEGLRLGGYAKITVSDTGKGIEPEIIDRVFDPYFTTKAVDKGLGIGLAVVYGIVKKHDGAICIESEIGNGTTVEVLFPLIEAQAEETVKRPDDLPTGTESILFVDDDASLVIIAKQMLERLKYDVIEKTDSMEALILFKSKPDRFDLVITDMAMPLMAGDRLARELLKIRPDIPIVLCTGHSDHVDEKKAKELGIRAYAMKPLTMIDLANTVRKVLDEAKTPG